MSERRNLTMMLAISPGLRTLPQKRASADSGHAELTFTVLILASALALQRFGLLLGTSYVSIVGPIGLLLAGTGLRQGWLALDFGRLMIFGALVASIMAGSAIRAAFPDAYGAAPSWLSLLQFVGLSAFGVFVFDRPVDEKRFFHAVNAVFTVLAAAGILQFVVQFAGVSLFSFSSFVPANLLLEGPYNTVIPIGVGSFDKSNGLVLVEPSVFSQMMALAVIIEVLVLRRSLRLLLFAAGLVTSISGTGWLMILTFVLTAVLSLGARGLIMSVATVAVGVVALGGLSLAFPAGFDVFVQRTGEIYAVGSSGHDRFVTPWWLAGFVMHRTPLAALYGLGPGTSEHLPMHPAWDYNTNPPVKIFVEYGIACVVFYIIFLLIAERTSTQKALLAPVLVLLLLDGGYSQFPPVLFPALLLVSVAKLSQAPPGAGRPHAEAT